jgi:pimeloyl-ACP methyl ester carboxylesterase
MKPVAGGRHAGTGAGGKPPTALISGISRLDYPGRIAEGTLSAEVPPVTAPDPRDSSQTGHAGRLVRSVGAAGEGRPEDWVATDAGPITGASERAPVLVLVHGLGTDASAWNRLTDDLQRTARVITVDLPGYALTTATDRVPPATELADGLAALLTRLGISSAVLIGHSFGGAVSLLTAQRHPDRCAGLVMIAPGGFGTELNPFLTLLNTRMGGRLLHSLYRPRASRTIQRLAGRVTSRAIGAADARLRIAELMETYERLRTEQARAQFRASVRESLTLSAAVDRTAAAGLSREIPILVLWGRDDRVLPAWQAQTVLRLLPWSVVHVLDGAGHTPHRSIPDAVRNEITAFADRADVGWRLRDPSDT